MNNYMTLLRCLAGSLALAVAAPVFAADAVNIDAARKEGKVVWYSSTPIALAQKIATAFEDKYGIKVELFRSGGSAILGRYMQERKARRNDADVLTASDPVAYAALAKEGAFVAFNPDGYEHIPADLRDPDGYYIAQRLNVISIYGRTDIIPADQLPKSWDALLDPKYKGKLVMSNPSFTVLQLAVVASMVKLRGWEYYEKMQANDVMIVKGGQQINDMVNRGERPIAGGTDGSYAIDGIKAGRPIENIIPAEGTFIVPAPTAVIKGSPHPEAAKLLAEFMISKEVQGYFPEEGNYAARDDIVPPAGSAALKDIKTLPIAYDYMSKSSSEIKKKFNEIFLQ